MTGSVPLVLCNFCWIPLWDPPTQVKTYSKKLIPTLHVVCYLAHTFALHSRNGVLLDTPVFYQHTACVGCTTCRMCWCNRMCAMQHPCLHVHMVSRLQIYLKFVLALKSNTFLCFTFKGLEFADGMFVHSGFISVSKFWKSSLRWGKTLVSPCSVPVQSYLDT